MAQNIRDNRPKGAWQLAPWDARNGAAYAGHLVLSVNGAAATLDGLSLSASIARSALRGDATAVDAVAALAVTAQVAGRQSESDRLFSYAERLSRRDLSTQLWAIERAVARNDIATALHHYDTTFRTTPDAPILLFPILAAAASDPAIERALIVTLAARPPWAERFLGYLVSNSDPVASARFVAALRAQRIPVALAVQAQLVSALVTAENYDSAWAAYISTRQNLARDRSRNPRFAIDPFATTPFDWMLGSEPGVAATMQRTNTAGLLDFNVDANAAGVLAQQLQLLPPGKYRLSGHSSGIDQPPFSQPFWALRCQSDGRELGRVIVTNSAEKGGIFSGKFNVPVECPVQMMALIADPSEAIGGVSGQIDRVELTPLGAEERTE